jgi:uncharacterized protein YecE (DUF72 family)
MHSNDEINELAEKVKAAHGQTILTFVLFNNHWKRYAPRNAGDIREYARRTGQDISTETCRRCYAEVKGCRDVG